MGELKYYFEEIEDDSKVSLGGIRGLIQNNLKKKEFQDKFSKEGLQWIEQHFPKLPLLIKDIDFCLVLSEINKTDALSQYEIGTKHNIHRMKVYRISNKLKKLGLIFINGVHKGISKSKPCYANRKHNKVINFILNLGRSYHGEPLKRKM